MSDLIKLTGAKPPYDAFWVSASSIVLVEPLQFVYGGATNANAKVLIAGGVSRQCAESAAEVERFIRLAHSRDVEVTGE